MSTANKLTYLNTTKNKIKNTLECGGAEIATEPFREYPEVLYDQYVDAVFNGAQAIYEGMPKVSAEGIGIALGNTAACKLALDLKGNTQQDGEPTPTNPIEIHNVSGDNTIKICGKNMYKGTDPLTERYTYMIRSKIGETYTLSFKGSTTATGGGARAFLNNHIDIERSTTATDSETVYLTSTSSSYNLTLTSTINGYLFLSLANPISVFTIQDIMLEKGSTATTYEPYQGNSQLISLGVENLWDFANNNFTNQNAFPSVRNSDGSITFTCSNNGYCFAKHTISLNAGTYTLSTSSNSNFTILIGGTEYGKTFTINETKNVDIRCFKPNSTIGDTLTITWVQLEKGSKANSYSPYGASYIELNKISTYQDYIYKTDKWYLHKEIGKVVLNGSENWQLATNDTTTSRFYVANSNVYNSGNGSDTNVYTLANKFNGVSFSAIYGDATLENVVSNYNSTGSTDIKRLLVRIPNSTATNVADLKTWLSTHNTIVYYVLATPTDTEITDTTLLEQLNNLEQIKSKKNQTNINQENNDLPFIITASAIKEYAEIVE